MTAHEDERLEELGVKRLLAPNPGALTLSGTNTWVVGRDPAWVVDPGPALPAHLDAIDTALATTTSTILRRSPRCASALRRH
jgi:hypothetical protein